MLRSTIVITFLLTAVCIAQQPNTPTATLKISGHDVGVYPLLVVQSSSQTFNIEVTGTPMQPFLVAGGVIAVPGQNFGDTGTLDIDMASAQILANGFEPHNVVDALANTNSTGTVVFGPFPSIADTDAAFQVLISDPSAPSTVRLTAATRFVVASGPVTRVNFTTEDETVLMSLQGSVVDYYGQTYSDIYVGSNGNVTFGAPDASDQPSDVAMLSGPPRAALAWRDLDPTAGGEVWLLEHSDRIEVFYFEVPASDGLGGFEADRVTGKIIIRNNGEVVLDLESSPDGDQITGFSPGGGLAAAGAVDVTADVPMTDGAGTAAFYEIFSDSAGVDLVGIDVMRTGPDALGDFTFDAAPLPFAVTDTFPPTGPDGGVATLVIEGKGLVEGTTVDIGSTAVPSAMIDHQSNEELVIRTPPGPVGIHDITVTAPGQAPIVLPGAYEYMAHQAIGIGLPFFNSLPLNVPFGFGFVFPFYDVWYHELWINSNGTLTFGGPDSPVIPSPTEADMEVGMPRIAILWADWQATPFSAIGVHLTPYFLTIGFVDVMHPSGGGPITFNAILSHHGEVFLEFTDPLVPGAQVLTGIAPGGALGLPSGSVDAFNTPGPTVPFTPIYELFGPANPWDLTGWDWDIEPATNVSSDFVTSTHN